MRALDLPEIGDGAEFAADVLEAVRECQRTRSPPPGGQLRMDGHNFSEVVNDRDALIDTQR